MSREQRFEDMCHIVVATGESWAVSKYVGLGGQDSLEHSNFDMQTHFRGEENREWKHVYLRYP